jgi:hypothetical protein
MARKALFHPFLIGTTGWNSTITAAPPCPENPDQTCPPVGAGTGTRPFVKRGIALNAGQITGVCKLIQHLTPLLNRERSCEWESM